ncbi:MAG: hypothetical protein E7677_05545 [Ruminococcaceae bacterium]|nr:hypothetical protein [Oscillospiraceae bacterium]
MKKKLLITLSLVLAIMSILGACFKAPGGTEETMGDETTGSSGTAEASLLINGVNATEYTLVYDSTTATGSTFARNYFNDTLMASHGIELEKSKTAVDGYNIFIGVMGTDATVKAFYDSAEDGMICYDGKNVYLLAKDNSQLYDVVDAFFAKKTESNEITVKQNEKITVPGDSIKVMSYNVLFEKYYDDNQPRDINKLAELISTQAPDVFGTQETQDFHYDAILEAMPNYECYKGVKLKGGAEMQNMIFWNADKFKLVEKGFRYLTATPTVVSKIPESNSYRGFSFVVLESLETHNQFLFVNVHLTYKNASGDTNDDTPRYKQAQFLKKFLESDKFSSMPTILVGDFNSVPSSGTIKLLEGVKRLDRAVSVTAEKGDTEGTINTTNGTERSKYIFDHIFVTSDRISTAYYTTLDEESKVLHEDSGVERYLSDHMPVIANVTIY